MNPSPELIQQAKAGDIHAFALLYQSVYKDLYCFALYTLQHPQDAEDVVSETVLDAFSQLRTLREDGAFCSWIFRILSNKCRRRIRDYINPPVELDDITNAHNAPAHKAEGDLSVQTDVRRAFAALPEDDRLILALNLFAGYSSQEIGEQLDMNPNTVRSRQSRALKKLEQMLS